MLIIIIMNGPLSGREGGGSEEGQLIDQIPVTSGLQRTRGPLGCGKKKPFFVFSSHFENDREFRHYQYLLNGVALLPSPDHSSDSCVSPRVREVL